MRKYANMLLVLGILAANPAWSHAQGLLSGLSLSKTSQQQANQQKAQQVADAMKRAELNGYDLGVEVRGDTVKLVGKVRDVTHRDLAERAAKGVPGIKRVLNDLSYVPQGGIQQTAGRYVDDAVRPATFYESAYGETESGVEQVHFQKPGKRTPQKRSTPTYQQKRSTMPRPAVKQPDHQVQVVQPRSTFAQSPPPAPPVEVSTPPASVSPPPVDLSAAPASASPPPIDFSAVPPHMPTPVEENVVALPELEVATALAPLSMPKPAAPAGPSNQEVAQNIANSMAEIGLVGYDVEIRYENGTAVLSGDVATVEQLQAAGIAASRVKGVYDVDNQLKIQGPIAQTGYGPRGAYGPQGGPSQVMPASMGMPPVAMAAGMQGGPTSIAGAGNYSNPNLPSHAWPAYAAYPNSAAIQYPKQYSASAWPYIGPFYPYPQVPLGWREVSLQWDDGHWQLDFEKKQKAWYWLWNPTNWH